MRMGKLDAMIQKKSSMTTSAFVIEYVGYFWQYCELGMKLSPLLFLLRMLDQINTSKNRLVVYEAKVTPRLPPLSEIRNVIRSPSLSMQGFYEICRAIMHKLKFEKEMEGMRGWTGGEVEEIFPWQAFLFR